MSKSDSPRPNRESFLPSDPKAARELADTITARGKPWAEPTAPKKGRA